MQSQDLARAHSLRKHFILSAASHNGRPEDGLYINSKPTFPEPISENEE